MEMQQIIEQAEQNIRQALKDYGKHTNQTSVLDDVSDKFIERLARDSSRAKNDLRNLFSKSPVWDERIDALVINGTRTHDPDYSRIRDLGFQIFYPVTRIESDTPNTVKSQIYDVIKFFGSPDSDSWERDAGIRAMNALAPKAYAPTKKPSRIFKAVCVALGVADETAGSEFQRLYARFADELSTKKISFKLYVSINPAHFLTMSNPKNDDRGSTLTSCHSFNSTEYQYNSGCIGYARDEVSFIVFTVDDPSNPESLNNRKTTRQIFAYKPYNGLLLQSRMYNTSGGTRGAQADSKLYTVVRKVVEIVADAANPDFPKYEYMESRSLGCWGAGLKCWGYNTFETEDGKILSEKEFLNTLPEEIRDDYDALLDYYTIGELENLRAENGDQVITMMCLSELGYSLSKANRGGEEVDGKQD